MVSEFVCVICRDGYSAKRRPMVMNCGHTLCEKCLTRDGGRAINKCPTCRTVISWKAPNFSLLGALDETRETSVKESYECEGYEDDDAEDEEEDLDLQMTEKEAIREADALRRIAFIGVAMSTAAVLTTVVAVPLFYNYLQLTQSKMSAELDFCKSRSANIWKEVTRTQVLAKLSGGVVSRDKRRAASSVKPTKEVAVDAVSPHLDLREPQVRMEILEPMDSLVHPERMVLMDRKPLLLLSTNSASTARMVRLDLLERLDRKDLMAKVVLPEAQEAQATPDPEDPSDLPETLVEMDDLERLELLELLDRNADGMNGCHQYLCSLLLLFLCHVYVGAGEQQPGVAVIDFTSVIRDHDAGNNSVVTDKPKVTEKPRFPSYYNETKDKSEYTQEELLSWKVFDVLYERGQRLLLPGGLKAEQQLCNCTAPMPVCEELHALMPGEDMHKKCWSRSGYCRVTVHRLEDGSSHPVYNCVDEEEAQLIMFCTYTHKDNVARCCKGPLCSWTMERPLLAGETRDSKFVAWTKEHYILLTFSSLVFIALSVFLFFYITYSSFRKSICDALTKAHRFILNPREPAAPGTATTYISEFGLPLPAGPERSVLYEPAPRSAVPGFQLNHDEWALLLNEQQRTGGPSPRLPPLPDDDHEHSETAPLIGARLGTGHAPSSARRRGSPSLMLPDEDESTVVAGDREAEEQEPEKEKDKEEPEPVVEEESSDTTDDDQEQLLKDPKKKKPSSKDTDKKQTLASALIRAYSLVRRSIAQEIVISEVLGRGRFGEVRRGLWKKRFVAVKIFSCPGDMSWRREVEIYNTDYLRHENVLQIIAGDKKSDIIESLQSWIITEFHERGSLYDYLSTHTVDRHQAIRMLHTLNAGMEFLHGALSGDKVKPPIAHRDMKSKNVLVRYDDSCVIADLGMAIRAMDGGELDIPQNTRCGTVRYLSPEVLDENYLFHNFADFAHSDMYSVGLVMWEVITRCNDVENELTLNALPFSETLPYWEWVGRDPTFIEMQQVVVVEKKRPVIPPEILARQSIPDRSFGEIGPEGQREEKTILGADNFWYKVGQIVAECLRADPHTRPAAATLQSELVEIWSKMPPKEPSIQPSSPRPSVPDTPSTSRPVWSTSLDLDSGVANSNG
ncbi:unnamed protein product, partial [Mesorhabditis spiculigera]